MNVNDVPQDKRDFKEGDKLRKVVYAVDKDGKYTGVNSAGWEVENMATRQAWDDIEEHLTETRRQVLAGTLSPLAWFMEHNLMDLALLARYAGKWQWQVRRHMKPDVFSKLSKQILEKYAGIFNITTDELINFGKEQGK
jgi:hypothetical protein